MTYFTSFYQGVSLVLLLWMAACTPLEVGWARTLAAVLRSGPSVTIALALASHSEADVLCIHYRNRPRLAIDRDKQEHVNSELIFVHQIK